MKFFILFLIFPLSCWCFDATFGNKSYPKFNETAFESELLSFDDEQLALKNFKPKVEENLIIGRRFILFFYNLIIV